jgi:molybdopterin-guanine dinucleotide biosynthesis protein A
MELAGHTGADVVLPWDGRDHYLAGVYRTDLADRIDHLVATGERSMRALADTVNTQRIVMAATPALTNVNSPTDLNAPSAAVPGRHLRRAELGRIGR